jgi:hypothetical protein
MMKNKSRKTTAILIAPCGMNCSLCRAYAREKKACPGCRGNDSMKTQTRLTCRIKNCEKLLEGGIDHCFDCSEFPCRILCHLDARYRTNYGMSMIDNLTSIKKSGIMAFVRKENERWACRECGEMICVHTPECRSCGHVWNKG